VAFGLLVACGCGDPNRARVSAPPFSASDGVKQALADYDTNKDGTLDGEEVKRCPGLLASFREIDQDGDGKLSADELEARMKTYSGVGLMSVSLSFALDGNLLQGATVSCVPERFMGEYYKPATGTTGKDGVVLPAVPGTGLPGVPHGCYRVEVSRKNASGQETIPARYNTNTTLGFEINGSSRGGPPPFRLTSRK
jgi:hypothetical protein